MSTHASSSPTPSTSPGLMERQGIEIVAESERTAKPSDLFWPWFAANISVFGMGYGSYILGFGVSFWQATLVTLIGIPISFFLCGLIAIAGKRGSAPTMVLSRAAFGVHGQKVPGIVSWLTSIGWETFLSIMAVLATATVFSRLGLPSGTPVLVAATVAVAALIVVASVLGYHTIMKLQSVLTWITGAITILYVLLTFSHIDVDTVLAVPNGTPQQVIGALVMVMTGFGLGWINIAADWSRYQKRETSDASIIWWNTLGGAIAPVLLVFFGVLLVASDPSLSDGIANDPIGTLASILPIWVLIPFWLTAVLALVSGAVLGIYSSGLTLLSLGINIPRPAAAAIDGVILTAGTIYVVFFAHDFLGPFQSFLITLGVPLAAWAGILIADILTRRVDYDEQALFDARGRYGSIDWISIATLIVCSVLGWGLVVNGFAEAAAWNNWQGYLLGPLGGRDGKWASANLGVLLALVLGFALTFVLRRGTIRRQEWA
ncbi:MULTISPECIES: purine-cytosine permease family protein [Dermabacter]|uniref:purine-cytosine permease family protein n=1 Tax=Dermabacter TaxID=36739 RepID=UPI0008A47AF3|nr:MULTISPECIES: cytosine permease [Dermabacter]MCT2055230.1 cytosine permease [Dermabacter hominis]MCT2083666.1 cytosine permease [Dermabacter hominis]MCT2090752.1 cytosine permease [Dermabacter hominis]MCT2189395.1 cytosine permease [Dermabacter hominis]MCT2226080.1 cytosine permease [Dermabacter hominis]